MQFWACGISDFSTYLMYLCLSASPTAVSLVYSLPVPLCCIVRLFPSCKDVFPPSLLTSPVRLSLRRNRWLRGVRTTHLCMIYCWIKQVSHWAEPLSKALPDQRNTPATLLYLQIETKDSANALGARREGLLKPAVRKNHYGWLLLPCQEASWRQRCTDRR